MSQLQHGNAKDNLYVPHDTTSHLCFPSVPKGIWYISHRAILFIISLEFQIENGGGVICATSEE